MRWRHIRDIVRGITLKKGGWLVRVIVRNRRLMSGLVEKVLQYVLVNKIDLFE